MTDINMRGLKEVFRKFQKTGKSVKSKNWQIEMGVDQRFWTLSYRWMPVLDCIKYKLSNISLDRDIFVRICNVIISEAAS